MLLPDVVVIEILSHLSFKERLRMKTVCRQWSSCVQHLNNQVKSLALVEINAHTRYQLFMKCDQTSHHFSSFYVIVNGLTWKEVEVRYLIHFPNLIALQLNGAQLFLESLRQLSQFVRHRSIQHFELVDCDVFYLPRLSIDVTWLNFFKRLKRVVHFRLVGIRRFWPKNSKLADMIYSQCKSLALLEVDVLYEHMLSINQKENLKILEYEPEDPNQNASELEELKML